MDSVGIAREKFLKGLARAIKSGLTWSEPYPRDGRMVPCSQLCRVRKELLEVHRL